LAGSVRRRECTARREAEIARVQVFEGGNIAPAQATEARLQPGNFGPGIGEGVARFGEAVSQAGEVADRIGELHDEAAVKEQVNGVNQHYADVGYTGADPFYSKQGKDALDARPGVEKGLDDTIKERRQLLQNERQRYLYDQAVIPQRQQWGIQIASHASKETTTYAATESAARAGMTAEMAGLTYVDNPQEGEQHLDTMRAEIANQGKLQGWGPERISVEQLKATSSVYQDIGLKLASEGPQGPELARKFAELHAGSMTNDDNQRVLTNARVRQDALEAEQRRIDSENRRLANEAKHDAHDRASTAAQNIDLGIPMKPEDYTSALSDAQSSGDEGLVHRIQIGQFKNSLNIEHQNDTPYQLQARVNDLNASINKAGANAKPEEVIERDQLTQLLGKSREQLKTNPLAWGAQHLGIQVQPLILSDPNSVSARMQAVAAISKNTGMSVAPLQPDEISVAQGTWSHGTTQQKIGLALKLSALGPMAVDAAEQVANNDPGFVNLVGLATHSNRSVAESRVNQIVTGNDALKTLPKLVDRTQASQQFNQYVGGALQFLPQVKAGAYSNAVAILASDASQQGYTEWGQVGRNWFRAVNSALGAYTKDGKQVGGLGTFNGAITVIPENMTQDEFDLRISKSNGPEFRKAANGEPVYADGRMPTATDLKRMHWVPSGDGVYRISDGNGFLKTKAGGFYEIDVSKLNSFDAQLAAHGYSRR
jgi:hypothetical protein